MTELKDCRIWLENISLSLAKTKLREKNEWEFSNQSGQVMYASIYLKNRRRNLVRLKLAVLKILETSQEHTRGGVLCY